MLHFEKMLFINNYNYYNYKTLFVMYIQPNQRLSRDADHCLKPKSETSTHESISYGKCFKELLL